MNTEDALKRFNRQSGSIEDYFTGEARSRYLFVSSIVGDDRDSVVHLIAESDHLPGEAGVASEDIGPFAIDEDTRQLWRAVLIFAGILPLMRGTESAVPEHDAPISETILRLRAALGYDGRDDVEFYADEWRRGTVEKGTQWAPSDILY